MDYDVRVVALERATTSLQNQVRVLKSIVTSQLEELKSFLHHHIAEIRQVILQQDKVYAERVRRLEYRIEQLSEFCLHLAREKSTGTIGGIVLAPGLTSVELPEALSDRPQLRHATFHDAEDDNFAPPPGSAIGYTPAPLDRDSSPSRIPFGVGAVTNARSAGGAFGSSAPSALARRTQAHATVSLAANGTERRAHRTLAAASIDDYTNSTDVRNKLRGRRQNLLNDVEEGWEVSQRDHPAAKAAIPRGRVALKGFMQLMQRRGVVGRCPTVHLHGIFDKYASVVGGGGALESPRGRGGAAGGARGGRDGALATVDIGGYSRALCEIAEYIYGDEVTAPQHPTPPARIDALLAGMYDR